MQNLHFSKKDKDRRKLCRNYKTLAPRAQLNSQTVKLKAKKQCFEKYCSCDKGCHFSALQGTPRRIYLENPTIDYKRVRLFIHQTCV